MSLPTVSTSQPEASSTLVPRLFHISDRPGIELFEPRTAPGARGPEQPCVWAVEETRLPFYFLPRDCPRVCFFAERDSIPADVQTLLGLTAARMVVAVETGWLDRIRRESLWLYELPSDRFTLFDAGAGHWIATESVLPIGVEQIDDLLARMLSYDVEFRITPSLWPLRDAVVASTLGFSCIRMRNARPR